MHAQLALTNIVIQRTAVKRHGSGGRAWGQLPHPVNFSLSENFLLVGKLFLKIPNSGRKMPIFDNLEAKLIS